VLEISTTNEGRGLGKNIRALCWNAEEDAWRRWEKPRSGVSEADRGMELGDECPQQPPSDALEVRHAYKTREKTAQRRGLQKTGSKNVRGGGSRQPETEML